MTGATWDEREARLRRFYAAVHTDRLLSSANAAMRVADEEQAELRDRLARVESAANALGNNLEPTEYARGQRRACTVIRYALEDQEAS